MIGKLVPIRRSMGDLREMTDEALVAACAVGDPAALAALFDRHGRHVYRFLVRLRGVDDHVVDDLVQETFVAACEGASRFGGGSAVQTWLLAIAGKVAKVHVRGEIRRRNRAAVFLEKFPGTPTRPDTQTEQHQLIDRMIDALTTLSHDQRVAFLLCDVEESRGVDVAKALGIRQGTLYRRLHDARKALRSAVLGDES